MYWEPAACTWGESKGFGVGHQSVSATIPVSVGSLIPSLFFHEFPGTYILMLLGSSEFLIPENCLIVAFSSFWFVPAPCGTQPFIFSFLWKLIKAIFAGLFWWICVYSTIFRRWGRRRAFICTIKIYQYTFLVLRSPRSLSWADFRRSRAWDRDFWSDLLGSCPCVICEWIKKAG